VLSYVVDATNRIVEIEGPWDEFATANGSPELTRAAVLGRSLFAFVTGADAIEVVSLLLARAHSTGAFEVGFRCDAPTRRRFMRLELRPEPYGCVRSLSRLVREEERAAQPLLDPSTPRTDAMLMICSWCKKVRVGDSWSEIEVAAGELSFLEAEAFPQISHGICPPCRAALR
jgi:hypothetical protein